MEMNIGTNIKHLRTAKGITQEQLSEAMNVTCAAVSKWERGETYPDITLLQPLAYYFGVTLDELMGYNQEKIQADIDNVLARYRSIWKTNPQKACEIIAKAYKDYPNDYRIMHYYMWNIAGDLADNDPDVLLAHKNEFLSICDKLLEGCADETLRLGSWNMRAKILHAEGRTEEALEIYRTQFTDWYTTTGQKSEQLFAKNTDEYYDWVKRNLYDLTNFAADKLGRVVFFDKTLSISEKAEKALQYGELFLSAAEKTGEAFFAILAYSFLCRMQNDLYYRGGSDTDFITVTDKYLYVAQMLTHLMKENKNLCEAFIRIHPSVTGDLLEWTVSNCFSMGRSRSAELLKNPKYMEILNKYR